MLGNQPQPIVLDAVARSYELRSMHLNTLPFFHGLATEDCLQFMYDYQAIVVTFPIGRLTEDQLRVRCFRYCLKDKGIKWYNSLKAWTRYSELLTKLPPHMVTEEYKVRTFYDGLTTFTQAIVDNDCGVSLQRSLR